MQPKMNGMVPHRRISRRGSRFHKEDIAVLHRSYMVTTSNGEKYRRGNHTWHSIQKESYQADGDSDRIAVDKDGNKLRGYSTYEY